LAVLPLSASNLQINGVNGFLYNTGVTAAGTTTSNNAVDGHWGCYVNCSAAGQATSTATSPSTAWPLPSTQNTTPGTGPWVASAGVSQWITPNVGVGGNPYNVATDPDTTTEYDYIQGFILSGFDPTSLEIIGSLAVDNTTFGIMINFKPVTGFSGGTSSVKSAFDITNASCTGGCFVSGTNTIEIRAENIQSGPPNPTGLLVEFTSATANSTAPEPATLFGVGLGLSLLGLVYRRRRS